MHYIYQWWCGLWWGHLDLFKVEGTRLYLECGQCGRETPGWGLTEVKS